MRAPLADVPPDRPVNGQHPYTSWILELPLRNADGSLGFAPALCFGANDFEVLFDRLKKTLDEVLDQPDVRRAVK